MRSWDGQRKHLAYVEDSEFRKKWPLTVGEHDRHPSLQVSQTTRTSCSTCWKKKMSRRSGGVNTGQVGEQSSSAGGLRGGGLNLVLLLHIIMILIIIIIKRS